MDRKDFKNFLIEAFNSTGLEVTLYHYSYNSSLRAYTYNPLTLNPISKSFTNSLPNSVQITNHKGDYFWNNYFESVINGKCSFSFNKEEAILLLDYSQNNNTQFKKELLQFMQEYMYFRDYVQVIKNDKQYLLDILDYQPTGRKQGTKDDFNHLFSVVKKYKYSDTKEVYSLFHYAKYYRSIIKRADTITRFCEFVHTQVDSQFHPLFEKLLKRPLILNNNTPLFQINNSLSLEINKQSLFDNIKFPHLDIPHINNLNTLHRFIINVFNDPIMKEKFGLDKTQFVDFDSTRKSTTLLFHFNKDTHKEEVMTIYSQLVEVLSKTMPNNTQNFNYMEVAAKWLESYELDNFLPEKGNNSTSSKKQKI